MQELSAGRAEWKQSPMITGIRSMTGLNRYAIGMKKGSVNKNVKADVLK